MSAKRLWVGVPLAVLVAILAHVAGFGSSHLPGDEHAAVLFGAVGLALAAFLGAAFLRPLRSAARISIATVPVDAKGVLALAAVAALAFAAIEVAEGRGLLGSALVPGLALVPLAGIVSWIARRVETFAGHTGTRVAAYLRRAPKRFSVLVMGMRAFGELWPAQIRGRRATRGRAPPRFA